MSGVEATGTLQVFLFALLTVMATGIGALPFIFVKGLTQVWLEASNAVAAGLMPDVLEETSANLVAIIVTLSVFVMVAFQDLIR